MMINTAVHRYCIHNDWVVGHHTIYDLSLSIFKQRIYIIVLY